MTLHAAPLRAHLTASGSVSQKPAPTARRAGQVTSRRSLPAAASCDAKVSTSLTGPRNASAGTWGEHTSKQHEIAARIVMRSHAM